MYHIREKWPGVDSHKFQRYWKEQTGKSIRTVKASQLRVREDARSPTSQTLYYIPGDSVVSGSTPDFEPKDITQCSMELFQEELGALAMSVLRQLATCCTNDLRNVFLIHDKRILGVVREQIPNLVARGVLTREEADLLEEGIIQTILPGTFSMGDLLDRSKHDTDLKNKYIIKPVRDAACNDILLGRNIPQYDWLALLERLSTKPLRPSEDAFIVQRLVDHVWYDIATHDEGGLTPEVYHLIGSQHVINSEIDVFGPWRLGKEVHVGLSGKEGKKKGIVMCSVLRPEGMGRSMEQEVGR